MGIPSLLRKAEHEALSGVTLSGKVLDLGGDKNSDYLRLFKGQFTTTSVNLARAASPDVLHDLENPLPFDDESYDHALLMNVLEHVFEYRQLLRESMRVILPGGSITILVPFLFPVHASPQDYHRFTASALEKELAIAGAEAIEVRPLASGIFRARYALIDRLLPKPFRLLMFYSIRYVAILADATIATVARTLGKGYRPEDYALGFIATGRKPRP